MSPSESQHQWLRIKVVCPVRSADSVEKVFLSVGVHAISIEDAEQQPILEPPSGCTPLWDKCILVGLFSNESQTKKVCKEITTTLPGVKIITDTLENRNWSAEYRKYFSPVQCGERLWVCPSWVNPPEPESTNLFIDPGLAFGTGNHPSTLLCLRWLDGLELKSQTILDFGCGSGVLGIASLLLGAQKVIAVDTDAQALTSTRENADRNNMNSSKLLCYFPDDLPSETKANIIVANILAKTLVGLAPKLIELTCPQGRICLSGILENQISEVRMAYDKSFRLEEPTVYDGWAMLCGQKD